MATRKPLGRSKLPGKTSILVDIGSKINIIGEETDKEFRDQAEASGHEVWYKGIPTLKVGGVGQGHTECLQKGTYPVAVDFKSVGRRLHQYTANVATGHGATLPAIYGLASMQEQDAVILLRKGKEQIVFPGAEGYKITWSPGTRAIELTTAPSGHLVIECDKYAGGQATTPGYPLTFVTDNTCAKGEESS